MFAWLSFSSSIFAQEDSGTPPIQWQSVLCEEYRVSDAFAYPLKKGGYIITGSINTSGSSDILVLKVNSKGSMIWKQEFGGEGSDIAGPSIESKNGEYCIVSGTLNVATQFNSGKDAKCWIAAIDKEGSLLWQTEEALSDETVGSYPLMIGEIKQKRDEFVLLGKASDRDVGLINFIMAIKKENDGFSSDGSLAGRSTLHSPFPITNEDMSVTIVMDGIRIRRYELTEGRQMKRWERRFLMDISEITDAVYMKNGCIVVGLLEDITRRKIATFWLDSSGVIQWKKVLGNAYGYPRCVKSGNSDEYLIFSGSGVFKMTGNGELEWKRAFDAFQSIHSIAPSFNGGYLLVGSKRGKLGIFLAEIQENGQ